jgi:hypothetical protein
VAVCVVFFYFFSFESRAKKLQLVVLQPFSALCSIVRVTARGHIPDVMTTNNKAITPVKSATAPAICVTTDCHQFDL